MANLRPHTKPLHSLVQTHLGACLDCRRVLVVLVCQMPFEVLAPIPHWSRFLVPCASQAARRIAGYHDDTPRAQKRLLTALKLKALMPPPPRAIE